MRESRKSRCSRRYLELRMKSLPCLRSRSTLVISLFLARILYLDLCMASMFSLEGCRVWICDAGSVCSLRAPEVSLPAEATAWWKLLHRNPLTFLLSNPWQLQAESESRYKATCCLCLPQRGWNLATESQESVRYACQTQNECHQLCVEIFPESYSPQGRHWERNAAGMRVVPDVPWQERGLNVTNES